MQILVLLRLQFVIRVKKKENIILGGCYLNLNLNYKFHKVDKGELILKDPVLIFF